MSRKPSKTSISNCRFSKSPEVSSLVWCKHRLESCEYVCAIRPAVLHSSAHSRHVSGVTGCLLVLMGSSSSNILQSLMIEQCTEAHALTARALWRLHYIPCKRLK